MRNDAKKAKKSAENKGSQSQGSRFLAYALPRGEKERDESRVILCKEAFLHDEPLGSSVSFLDFDGVVTFAGTYDQTGQYGQVVCTAPADLDRREREFFTAIEQRKALIFLVPDLPIEAGGERIDSSCGLFRRVAKRLRVSWNALETPCPTVSSLVPEFREYVSRFGTGYVSLKWNNEKQDWIRPICSGFKTVFGIALGNKVFFLPCTKPHTSDQPVEMATAALEAVMAYRARVSQEMPEWTAEFAFSQESPLRKQVGDLRGQITQIEGQIDSYVSFIEACIANARRATNGSPVFKAFCVELPDH